MKISLKELPKSPTIIQGFPGFGLIGTISTEFLIQHLKAEKIGEICSNDFPATVAIHNGELVNPMAVYYAKKENIMILHTILNVTGQEWKIADEILDMAKKVKAKEIICIEGVPTNDETENESKLMYYSYKDLTKHGFEKLNESIILGVTASILLKHKKTTCLLAKSHLNMPDSKAAAKIIEGIDKYLNLKVDYTPLLAQAKLFENKVKTIYAQNKDAVIKKKAKEDSVVNYFG
jgi:uncharacterized protein